MLIVDLAKKKMELISQKLYRAHSRIVHSVKVARSPSGPQWVVIDVSLAFHCGRLMRRRSCSLFSTDILRMACKKGTGEGLFMVEATAQ